ncbi:putative 2-haloalkanoic acid dehalogenase [Dactylonectria macrodidyma]|uniref:2-haloalkanoic acid dehalogenase n=1 Tax=Dactylonectria macrodidyma TaxID=307937 RepID=A0A9P9EQA6_9HYPO|nr:putative 2-haloalkanoic acid dehalogenase [Dactylonectria macrodidyma]
MTKQKHVVFDVVGTCVSFDAFYNCIDRVIGEKLVAKNITANAFGFTWMTAAELEFTFLSISERHRPYKDVLSALFFRTLFMVGVTAPREFATDAERDACVQGYSELELRPGTKECFATLRDAGFTVWCLTTGDTKRVGGYFERAGVDMPLENLISCDGQGVAKPALAAYKPTLARFAPDDIKWFAAAHMWDVSAAVKVGFRGAYCTVYEQDPCAEIFDTQMEVMADTLPKMAKGIVEASL